MPGGRKHSFFTLLSTLVLLLPPSLPPSLQPPERISLLSFFCSDYLNDISSLRRRRRRRLPQQSRIQIAFRQLQVQQCCSTQGGRTHFRNTLLKQISPNLANLPPVPIQAFAGDLRSAGQTQPQLWHIHIYFVVSPSMYLFVNLIYWHEQSRLAYLHRKHLG
jgi:hypothetical protein